MGDISRLMAELCDQVFPNFPIVDEEFPTDKIGQTADITAISHISHISHSENRAPCKYANPNCSENTIAQISDEGVARATSLSDLVGNVGNVGNIENPAASSVTCDFPLPSFLEQRKWESGKSAAAGGLKPPSPPPDLTTANGLTDAFLTLNSAHPPCPGYRSPSEWQRVFDQAYVFLEQHAEAALSLGWTAVDLFSAHRVVGIANVSACGALVLPGSPATAVERDLIRFNGLVFRRTPPSPEAVLIWDFRS